MPETAHKLQTVVGNIEDEKTAVAIATDWLRDDIGPLDIVNADASSSVGETTVQFTLRMTDLDVETIESSEKYLYMGEC